MRTMRRQTIRVQVQVAQVFRAADEEDVCDDRGCWQELKKWMNNNGFDEDAQVRQVEVLKDGQHAVWRDATVQVVQKAKKSDTHQDQDFTWLVRRSYRTRRLHRTDCYCAAGLSEGQSTKFKTKPGDDEYDQVCSKCCRELMTVA